MARLIWYLRQLFPLTYRSRYRDGAGCKRFAAWKMWMGRVFDYEDYAVVE